MNTEKPIYTTKEWSGYGKNNYYYNQYRLKDDEVFKYKCHEFKFFDGDENNWDKESKLETSWKLDDPDMPSWLSKYL